MAEQGRERVLVVSAICEQSSVDGFGCGAHTYGFEHRGLLAGRFPTCLTSDTRL